MVQFVLHLLARLSFPYPNERVIILQMQENLYILISTILIEIIYSVVHSQRINVVGGKFLQKSDAKPNSKSFGHFPVWHSTRLQFLFNLLRLTRLLFHKFKGIYNIDGLRIFFYKLFGHRVYLKTSVSLF